MAKQKFNVSFREVHSNTVIVEAENEKTAIEVAKHLMASGEVEAYTEYSHTLGDEHTTVSKAGEEWATGKTDIDPDDIVEHEERWDTFVD